MAYKQIFTEAMVQGLFAEYETGKAVTVGDMTFQKAEQQPQAETPAPAPVATIPHLTQEALAAANAAHAAAAVAKAEAEAAKAAEAQRIAEVRATAKAFNAARTGKR